MKMTGNTILITGGGSGIGRELALRFNALGNTVIIAGRRKEALERTIAGREGMHAMVGNVEDPEAIAAFAKRVVAEHPALNVLINNAGIMRREDLTRTRDLRDAEETIVTNLFGPIRLTNALVDHLATRQNAVIVNVSSGLAFVPLSGTPTYNATKAAIVLYGVVARATQGQGRSDRACAASGSHRTHARPVDARRLYAAQCVCRRGDGVVQPGADPQGDTGGARGLPALGGAGRPV